MGVQKSTTNNQCQLQPLARQWNIFHVILVTWSHHAASRSQQLCFSPHTDVNSSARATCVLTCGAVDGHDDRFADEETHRRGLGAELQTTLDVHHSLPHDPPPQHLPTDGGQGHRSVNWDREKDRETTASCPFKQQTMQRAWKHLGLDRLVQRLSRSARIRWAD